MKVKSLLTGIGNPFILPKGLKLFNTNYNFGESTAKLLYAELYGMCPSTIESNTLYTIELLDFLRKNGKLICDETFIDDFSQSSRIKTSMDDAMFEDERRRYFAYFLLDDSIIFIDKVADRKLQDEETIHIFKIMIFYAPGSAFDLKKYDKYIAPIEEGSFINTIIKTDAGIEFHPFRVDVPETFDIKTNYEPEFEKVHDDIISNLKEKKSGLYLFHGPHGTGKTTFIKYLASKVNRDVIYVPVAFIDSLIDPGFIPALLNKKGCIIIIEDAEKALLNREDDNNSSMVSTILNITDGIMGDIFKISIIATYNSKRDCIDAALMRKGRLKVEYKFDNLKKETAQNLIDKLGIDYKVTKAMSLADIYNLDTKDNINTPELKKDKFIGFGN